MHHVWIKQQKRPTKNKYATQLTIFFFNNPLPTRKLAYYSTMSVQRPGHLGLELQQSAAPRFAWNNSIHWNERSQSPAPSQKKTTQKCLLDSPRTWKGLRLTEFDPRSSLKAVTPHACIPREWREAPQRIFSLFQFPPFSSSITKNRANEVKSSGWNETIRFLMNCLKRWPIWCISTERILQIFRDCN